MRVRSFPTGLIWYGSYRRRVGWGRRGSIAPKIFNISGNVTIFKFSVVVVGGGFLVLFVCFCFALLLLTAPIFGYWGQEFVTNTLILLSRSSELRSVKLVDGRERKGRIQCPSASLKDLSSRVDWTSKVYLTEIREAALCE